MAQTGIQEQNISELDVTIAVIDGSALQLGTSIPAQEYKTASPTWRCSCFVCDGFHSICDSATCGISIPTVAFRGGFPRFLPLYAAKILLTYRDSGTGALRETVGFRRYHVFVRDSP